MPAHSEDDAGSGGLLARTLQRVHVERVDGEHVPMVAVAFRRTRPLVGRRSGIVVSAYGAGWRVSRARAGVELRGRGGNPPDEPVPVPRPGRRVGVETGDSETLCARRRAAPRQLRRAVLSAIARRDVLESDLSPV